jgi:hypothetical protein
MWFNYYCKKRDSPEYRKNTAFPWFTRKLNEIAWDRVRYRLRFVFEPVFFPEFRCNFRFDLFFGFDKKF